MKIIKTILILAVALLSLASCIAEELADNRVLEGEPTLMKLSLQASFRNDTPQSRAASSELNENKFSNIRVMVFNSSGEVVTNYKQVYSAPQSKPTMNINTFSGNDCSVYIIANAVKELDNALMHVESKDQLNEVKTTALGLGLALTSGPLLMTGIMKPINITPITNIVSTPVQMEYVSAKLTLKVVDNTPLDHDVAILGWDIENASLNTYLIPNGGSDQPKDANDDLIDEGKAWINTSEQLMPFDKEGGGVAYLTQALLENRRGERVDISPLPQNKYTGMSIDDGDHRGKAFFAPKRATCIVIHAIHRSPQESRVLEARIYIGNDNHSDYNIERGKNYEFTVTVKGIDDIEVDTNLDTSIGNFAVHVSSPLGQMDSHPDFRPIKIDAPNGTAIIEVLDEQGRSCSESGFNATWVKISPLDLMYHQVKQSSGDWQQQGTAGHFVRPKYIPHKSVRTVLEAKGVKGWNTITAGQEDDDSLALADATYRMCYKITDIFFPEGAVTGKQLYIYTDDYNEKNAVREAKIKVTFYPKGSPEEYYEEKIFSIIQNGYMGIYEDGGGLAVLDEQGTPGNQIEQFGVEQFEESGLTLYPNLSDNIQTRKTMQWGFTGEILYNELDKYRNGYFLTANTVYGDVSRQNNEPASFSMYRPKYSDGHDKTGNSLVEPYSGSTSGEPYFTPPLSGPIYHPIYNSSAARYCHEKNRDLNGDGAIDNSETVWYLPSQHELMLIWISNIIERDDYQSAFYSSSTEIDEERCWFVNFAHGSTVEGNNNNMNLKTNLINVRCVRRLSK